MVKKIKSPNKINNIVNIQSVKDEKNITLNNVDGYFNERFYYQDIYDNTKMKNFIKSVERQVRTSDEYSNYIHFLTSDIGLTHCAILGNIEKSDATVEMHHYPFTLWDIVNTIVSDNIIKEKRFNTFTVTRQVLDDHFNNIIGIVPLSKTVHQLAHTGDIFVNLNQVFGDINAFNEKYNASMTDEIIERFNKLVDYSNKHVTYSENDILKKVYEKNKEDKDSN